MHNRWHPDIAPVVTVAPGDELTLDVEDGIAGLLTRESTHADCAVLDLGLAHPLAGPVEVEGARPGDVLEVEFLGYTSSDFGVTAVIPGFGFLADRFTDPYLVKWEIEDGVARSGELAGVAVPAEMFAGVVGVAPSMERMTRLRVREERIRDAGGPVADPMPESAVPRSAADGLRTIPPRETGGNLDIRQLVAGSRLYVPVDVPGALFSIGDLHFAQGDGEVCGTAIEVAGSVTVALHVHERSRPARPVSDVRDARAAGPALVCDNGNPCRRRHGSHRCRPGGPERHDRLPRGSARVRTRGGLCAL